ncbi:hypothetical protein [Chryseobacterium sp. MMS23-Vi53]|uniref:hypothetical protein n=1 Tax=Chryseobacterium sp. MMS23-Vi53 TaxID=3386644 RepID=UPI0039ED0E34
MSTFRDNLEEKIRKQIEEREITPSRNLWSEIELQKGVKSSKSNLSWILAAACIVLAFGLGFVIFSNPSGKNTPQNTIEIAEVKNTPVQEKAKRKINDNKISKPVYAEKKIINENKSVSTKIINEVQHTPKVLAEQKTETPKKEEIQVTVPEKSNVQVPVEKVIAQSEDIPKTPAKKKKYVDPATLLFSVEHKDVIEKTKESNVATVDLNGK